MTSAAIEAPTVAIVGGGFSGAAVAYHLAKAGAHARILVFEPRESLGAGLAYSDLDPTHRINVPAKRMSLLPDDDTHFSRWLEASGALDSDPAARAGDAAFPARMVFGRYVDAMLRPFVEQGRINHIRDKVVSARQSGHDWVLRTPRGEETRAQILVVATTHPHPMVPSQFGKVLGDPRLIQNSLADGALDGVLQMDRVLIVGCGLTAADIVASLDARGHEGHVTMISRRGQRSRGHAPRSYPAEGDFTSEPAREATRIVAAVRQAVRKAVAEGRSWHPVLDAVRIQGAAIWAALEPRARLRLVRHVRPYWDAHRFRIAPQIETILDRKLADGSLELRKASLGHVERIGDEFAIDLIDSRRGSTLRANFDRVIVATGPAHNDIPRAQPYLGELVAAGAVGLDPTGLGLNTGRDGRAIRTTNEIGPPLFIAGPLARGAVGELMGLPECSVYARFIAEGVFAALSALPAPIRAPGPTSESVA